MPETSIVPREILSDSHGSPLVVCIEARLTPGECGGVEQVIVGLAHGLSALGDGDEQYVFITTDDCEWLRPYVAGPASLHVVSRATEPEPTVVPLLAGAGWRAGLAARMPGLAGAWGRFKRRYLLRRPVGPVPAEPAPEPVEDVPPLPVVPVSDGTVEALGARIIHFPYQAAYLTDVPSIFHPHDLQHLHLPEFFTPEHIEQREREYRAFCDQATMVTVTTEWGRRDLIDQYGLPEDRVVVVPLAPALSTYDEPTQDQQDAAAAQLGLPEAYVFYPAQTWPHKNHLRLLEAIASLRDAGVSVSLVCSGRKNEHFPVVAERLESLGLSDLVRFVGFVDPITLQVLYRRARAVVFPTMFEAAGGFGPLFEAFSVGVPIACSTATSLAEQAADAALLFDPLDVEGMASCIRRLWDDDALRAVLARRGLERVGRYTWDRTVRTFRAHYRRIAGWPMSADDSSLIEAGTEF